jgi:penicillin-binding protein A
VTETRNQRLRRAFPVIVLATVAFASGAILGARHGASPDHSLAEQFVSAWTARNYASMYTDISLASQHATPVSEFAADYQQALVTATARSARVAGVAHSSGDVVTVPVHVRTRLFGTLSLAFTLHFTESAGSGPRVAWSPSLVFPGLRPGESLTRNTALPQRAALLARDGSVLAEAEAGSPSGTQSASAPASVSASSPGGDDGASPEAEAEATPNSPLGSAADAVIGTVGPIPASRRRALEEQGVPPNATVGLSGLELAFDARLRGTPGGQLLARSTRPGAADRVLATATAHAAPPLRTSVSASLQRVAATALGGQYGGVVAMLPSTGQILAAAGLGLDGLQPPGSTFKMITTTGVLSARIATPNTVFPYATYATLDGVKLSNANGEDCGGSLELAFAVSCNSVFSPLGVRLGASRLVATAERYGFNHAPAIAGVAESTLPPASQIQGELDVGSTAIGQGQVLASPLEMADVAATIGDGGTRPQPTFSIGPPAARVPVSSRAVADTMRQLMIAVVREGTGTAAAIPGVTVAGKTGTAELRSASELKSACPSSSQSTEASSSGEAHEATKEGCESPENEAANTDAWFAAFAPAVHPRIVVCVLLVKDGAGGATAAPVARQVLEAALAESS